VTTVTILARIAAALRTSRFLCILLTRWEIGREGVRMGVVDASPTGSPTGYATGSPTGSRRRLELVGRTIAITAVLLSLVVALCTVAAVVVLRRDLTSQYEQRALAIARTVAEDPLFAHEVATVPPTPSGVVQSEAEQVRRATGALYVVVTDDRGIRYSHPDPDRIGQRVSTSPEEALAGREVMTVERGTLGDSARGKVPLRDSTGTVIGEVSVGIAMDRIDADTRQLATLLGAVALVTLGLGLSGALVVGRRLRRSTLGLQPEQMADLLREHEAVLRGVRDAIIGVDNDGRVTVTNPQAEALLGTAPPRGLPLDPETVGPVVVELMTQEPAPVGVLRVLGDKAVLATRLVVRREGRDLGQVLILRDRSDLDTLARELEATRALTDALRAQAHEHSNRLHALQGLLHLGRFDEAEGYLEELSAVRTWVPGLDDPYLAGLLAAKAAAASETGVALSIDEATFVSGTLARPLETVTVVGNLLDNAIRAASLGDRRPATVAVTLLSNGSDLVVHLVDSGAGVPPELVETVFEHGYTTRASEGADHGIGLSLARHTARAHGGDVVLVDPGGDGHGAVFEARLAGALHHHEEETG
jgi:two-component system CitB family sensor kinase